MIKFRTISLILTLTLCLLGCKPNTEKGTTYKKTYYENGKLLTEVPIIDGKAHGIKKEYFNTGELRKEVPYDNGKVHGTIKTKELQQLKPSRII